MAGSHAKSFGATGYLCPELKLDFLCRERLAGLDALLDETALDEVRLAERQ